MGLGLLSKGKWVSERTQEDEKGQFTRPSTTFRSQITADGSSGFQAEANRYHLYVSLACPWAHRTLLMRQLKGLSDAISVSIVDPIMGEHGWEFSTGAGCIPDSVNQAQYLWQIYIKVDQHYTGRVTVPILWDKQRQTIVNNESREIIRMLDREFGAVAQSERDLCPPERQKPIDETIDAIYQPINNGVYRAGFATQQTAYDAAVTELFTALDQWETLLGQQRYLCGNQLTEADLCLFTTLLRFDAVYYGHFKCNLRRIVDYPNLWGYLRDIYQIPGVAATCNLDHIKRHYYISHSKVNPTQIVPQGPILDFNSHPERDRFGS